MTTQSRHCLTRLRGVALAGLLAGTACENAGSSLGFGEAATGTIRVGIFLDRDGSKTPSAIDTTPAQIRVQLQPAAGGGVVRSQLTDQDGLAVFEGVPFGEYRVRPDPTILGDSLLVGRVDSATISVVPTDTIGDVVVRLDYPETSVKAARALPTGRRIFLRGILISTLQTFRDTTVHLADTSGFLRLTGAGFLGSTTGNNAGDSVTVIAYTGQRDGQPVATQARIFRLALRPPPVPIPVSSAVAATADLGRIDAALVQVTSATISDSVTVAPDFKVVASDGSGNLEILIDGTIPVNRTLFRPGRTMTVRGVLVPNGAGGWRLKPRDGSDIQLF